MTCGIYWLSTVEMFLVLMFDGDCDSLSSWGHLTFHNQSQKVTDSFPGRLFWFAWVSLHGVLSLDKKLKGRGSSDGLLLTRLLLEDFSFLQRLKLCGQLKVETDLSSKLSFQLLQLSLINNVPPSPGSRVAGDCWFPQSSCDGGHPAQPSSW